MDFENFKVKDLYYDLQEIVNSQKNLDKKEIYLYFSEIEIEKRRFPLFYTQINIKEYARESHFQISFSNEMFVNKRAVQYALDVLKKDDKVVETFTEERKIYISEETDFSKRLNDIINTLIPKLRLEGKIDLKNTEKQIAKSISFVISNNCRGHAQQIDCTGNGILLYSEFWHPQIMDDICRSDLKSDWLIHRQY